MYLRRGFAPFVDYEIIDYDRSREGMTELLGKITAPNGVLQALRTCGPQALYIGAGFQLERHDAHELGY
jgi:hypothetical protein